MTSRFEWRREAPASLKLSLYCGVLESTKWLQMKKAMELDVGSRWSANSIDSALVACVLQVHGRTLAPRQYGSVRSRR